MDFSDFKNTPFGDLSNNEILKAICNYKGTKKRYYSKIYSRCLF